MVLFKHLYSGGLLHICEPYSFDIGVLSMACVTSGDVYIFHGSDINLCMEVIFDLRITIC